MKEKERTVIYADCPGEFDNKGIVQNICNARLIEYLTKKAQQVKVTMVADQSSLGSRRGIVWNETVRQLDRFMDMNVFLKQNSLSMVVTKFCELEQKDNPLEEVRSLLDELEPEEKKVNEIRDYILDNKTMP
eukprot:TRINITY_DN1770_c0_g1_i2.p1 TRINITY_DN1770_c0_g1~~TRINITY_DN1770_c0_g1_i2.p1  ORF type:complete len:132 (-),score=20.85 TRINITY_DN1770_c0_g1_i2:719-1114(-)